MRPIKGFGEFVDDGTVRKISPDMPRARSLVEEAGRRKNFLDEMLEKIGINDENANYFIESSYDVLIGLIRAKLLTKGFSSSGKGAHEAEVSFMKKLGFPEKDIRFMNGLRFYRNGILYYGKQFDADYGKRVLGFLKKTFTKLNI